MKSYSAVLLLGIILTTHAHAQTAESVLGFPTGKVVIEGATLLTNRSGGQAYVMIFTPQQTDLLLRMKRGRAKDSSDADFRQGIRAMRTRQTVDARHRYGRRVQLCLIYTRAFSGNADPFVIWSDYQYGLQRDQLEMPSQGLANMIVVQPAESGFGFIIFRNVKFQPADAFYVKFP